MIAFNNYYISFDNCIKIPNKPLIVIDIIAYYSYKYN